MRQNAQGPAGLQWALQHLSRAFDSVATHRPWRLGGQRRAPNGGRQRGSTVSHHFSKSHS